MTVLLPPTDVADPQPARTGTRWGAREIRSVIMIALAMASLLGCAGITASVVFDQYSTVKWLATVFGPVVVLLLMSTQRPVTYIALGVVAGLPFIPLEISLAGLKFSPVLAMLGAGVVVAFASSDRSRVLVANRRTNAMISGAVIAGVLLLPATLRSIDLLGSLTPALLVTGLGYLVDRAVRLDRHAPAFVLATFSGMAGVQGLIALREFSTGRAFNPYGAGVASHDASYFFSYEGAFRPSGAFFDPISLGNVLAIACAMTAVLACSNRFPLHLRLWFGLTGLTAAGALVVTLSRMSWIGAVVGLAVAAILSPGRVRLQQIALWLVGAVVVSATAVVLAGDRLLARFNSIFNPTGTGVSTASGDETRRQLWAAATDTFMSHPVWGVGTGNLNAYLVRHVGDSGPFSHAHSTYLQHLAESGVLGGMAIVALLGGAVATLASLLKVTGRSDPIVLASAAALAAVAVVWTTDFAARYPAVLGCMAVPFILAAAMARPAQQVNSEVGQPW